MAIRVNAVRGKIPLSAPTIPAIVGSVARATPPAIARGELPPTIAMTSKITIMPVTVPSRPSKGHSLVRVRISSTPASMRCDRREMSAS